MTRKAELISTSFPILTLYEALITASLSEEFGRNPLYLGSGLGFTLMFVMIAKYKVFQLLNGTSLREFPGQTVFTLSSWDASFKEHLAPQDQPWSEAP